MNNQPRQIKLADLRNKFGQERHSELFDWVYRPEVLHAYGGFLPADQITVLINQQPTDEVCDQFDNATKQLLYRAHTGDERAARLLIARIGSAIVSLQKMVEGQHSMMQTIAEATPRWPVMLSLNPKDVQFVKDRLAELNVGAKAVTPTNPGQKVDLHTFWSELAKRAYEVCEFNRHLVPFLLEQAVSAPVASRSVKYWGTTVSAKYHQLLASREVIIILDWQAKCAELPAEVVQNFPAWWSAINGCLLDYWHTQTQEYEKALKEIGNTGESETRRRNLAMTQMRQAFKSLVGLRRRSPQVP